MADLDETNDAPLVLRRLTGTQRIMQEVALIITKPQVRSVVGTVYEGVGKDKDRKVRVSSPHFPPQILISLQPNGTPRLSSYISKLSSPVAYPHQDPGKVVLYRHFFCRLMRFVRNPSPSFNSQPASATGLDMLATLNSPLRPAPPGTS